MHYDFILCITEMGRQSGYFYMNHDKVIIIDYVLEGNEFFHFDDVVKKNKEIWDKINWGTHKYITILK